jgi:hypothetical protein
LTWCFRKVELPDLGSVQDAGFVIKPALGALARGHVFILALDAGPELDLELVRDGPGDVDRGVRHAAVVLGVQVVGKEAVGPSSVLRASHPLPSKDWEDAEGDKWQQLDWHGETW